MFELPRGGERALLVHLALTRKHISTPLIDEFVQLVTSASIQAIHTLTTSRQEPDNNYFIGVGKLEELRELVTTHQIDLVLFNHTLSPAQERNLEKELNCQVRDRNGLILAIFAKRARTSEGKLQVELARLVHLKTRLVRGWTHLEKQQGGIGVRGGPGEKQIELDRRLIDDQIKRIRVELEQLTHRRQLNRKARQRAEIPVVALVGYTNAGKSTLFNYLTRAKVYAADQLFATLDATARRVELPSKQTVIFTDTVGFIQQLPHDLIAAFHSTLDETREADLLLHIVDASDPERALRIEQVNQVLTEIEANHVPQVLVYNKIDLLADEVAHFDFHAETQEIQKIWLSAHSGEGIAELLDFLANQLGNRPVHHQVRIPASEGRLRAQLFKYGNVLNEQFAENGDCVLEIDMPQQQFERLSAKEPHLQVLK